MQYAELSELIYQQGCLSQISSILFQMDLKEILPHKILNVVYTFHLAFLLLSEYPDDGISIPSDQ